MLDTSDFLQTQSKNGLQMLGKICASVFLPHALCTEDTTVLSCTECS